MKGTLIQLSMLFAIILISYSCKKKTEQEPKIEIDETNLTVCPDRGDCHYLFTEHADINDESMLLKIGDYRLFWIDFENPTMNSKLYIKARMQGKDFLLDKTAIVAGRVRLTRGCPSCLMSPFKILEDGFVKGINLTPGKPADQTKWLLEIKLIMEGMGTLKDTVYVKQYFYPNFIYN
jgi:hypothetical protein